MPTGLEATGSGRRFTRMQPIRSVSPSNLRSFFQRLVFPGFAELGIADRAVVDYVVDLLARFAQTDQLYRIRDARGQHIETIAEMLMELGRQRQPERRWSFDREVEIRRHVGDYALFSSGLFRVWVERQGLGDYYLHQGRDAYRAAADMAQLSFAPESRLFRALGEQFEHLAGALDYVRKVYMRSELHGGAYGDALREIEIL